jgi:hypothetical protein
LNGWQLTPCANHRIETSRWSGGKDRIACETIEQDDEGIDRERMIAPRRGNRLAQR